MNETADSQSWRETIANDRAEREERGGFKGGDMIAGRYMLIKRIGKGGMGAVYLAFDRKGRRYLALKTLLPQFASDAHAVSRFVREVISVGKLNHPGIVKMYDASRCGPILFYTMEYLPGTTLRQYILSTGCLDLATTTHILYLLSSALEHVHEHTIHRDISPENIMLLKDNTIRLLDFGLAKTETKVILGRDGSITLVERDDDEEEVLEEDQFTRVGSSLGKFQYIAPEQRDNAAHADRRADIYSLGVMFQEMLTGTIPRRYESISERLSELPVEADAFLKKALEPDPDDRYATATEFREALTNVYRISLAQNSDNAETAAAEDTSRAKVLFARAKSVIVGAIGRVTKRIRRVKE